jgi:endonuclease-8
MPEGDTIFRTAHRLRGVLEGHRILAVETRDPQFDRDLLQQRTVVVVESRGKHLLLHLDDRSAIHSHLGMSGSWHVYRHGQPWQKPAHWATLSLTTDQFVTVCFLPKTLEWLSADALRRNDYLRRLGPDLLAREPDFQEALRRLKLHGHLPIGEAVMNQTIVSGIGNVYKSEILFLNRINPLHPVNTLSDEQLTGLLQTARKLLYQNLQGYPRRTRRGRDGGDLWAYGRNGQPCFVCGTPLRLTRQGNLGRTTYFCPNCQSEQAP